MNIHGFTCLRCGACCRLKGGYVRLSDDDIKRIAQFLGVAELDFIRDETTIAPDRRSLVLRDHDDSGVCSMLDESGACRIHSVKPRQCREFPYTWRNSGDEEYCAGLRALKELE